MVHRTNLLSPSPQVWWSPTHTHTHTRKWKSQLHSNSTLVSFLTPIPLRIQTLSYTTRLDSPWNCILGSPETSASWWRNASLLCPVITHKREDSQIFSFTTDTDTHPSQHTQEVILPETPVSRSMHCTPLLWHLCQDTHTTTVKAYQVIVSPCTLDSRCIATKKVWELIKH